MLRNVYHLFLAITLFGFIAAACQESKGSSSKEFKNDTTWTAVAFTVNWDRKDHRLATAGRVIKDTLKVESANPEKNIKVRDTQYFVPMVTAVLDTVSKKPVLDSAGNPKTLVQWFELPKALLLEDYSKKF